MKENLLLTLRFTNFYKLFELQLNDPNYLKLLFTLSEEFEHKTLRRHEHSQGRAGFIARGSGQIIGQMHNKTSSRFSHFSHVDRYDTA